MIVVLPFWSGDIWLAKKNLEWYKELDGTLNYDCLLASDNDTNDAEVFDLAKTIFRSVNRVKYSRVKGKDKWPHQQNNAFMNVAWHMQQRKPQEPWFWCETDCTPLCPKWLETLEAEYKKGGKPFGGHWNDAMGVFNGVAIYPFNVPQECPIMVEAALIDDARYPNYQPPWDYYGSKKVEPLMHRMNNVMQHMWDVGVRDTVPSFPTINEVEKYIRYGVVLFHRVKDGTLINRMHDIRRRKIPVKLQGVDRVHFTAIVDIAIVSFRRDVEFTRYCLKAIAKFARGFRHIHLIVPRRDLDLFLPFTKEYSNVRLDLFNEVEGKGFLHHEAIVCSVDMYSDADYILHLDPDTIFKEPVKPDDYFVNGKPVLLKAQFDKLPAEVRPWQVAVENALGFKPEYETMRRHPAVHPRWIYPRVREAIAKHTGKPFLEYVLSGENKFPQTFAEFPTLGAWSLANKPDEYHWIDTGDLPAPPDKLIQFWSHGGVEHKYVDGPFVGRTAKQIIEDLLK